MLSRIIPFVRLPKDLADFSYSVPDEWQNVIKPGQIVQVPFRNKKILGLVKTIEDSNTAGLKSIVSVVNTTPFLNPEYISFLTELAGMYGVSPSVMIKIALPPLQITKFKKIKISDVRASTHKNNKAEYFQYHNTHEHQSAFEHYKNESIVIIVPELINTNEVLSVLPPERASATAVWHGELSSKEQVELWFKIRNGEIKTLIGTRSAVFLPLTQSFDRIIIDYEHAENHKHWDQSPRYHTKDIAKLLNRNFGLAYTEMSYSPSANSYYYIHKKNYQLMTGETLEFPQNKKLPIISDIQGAKGKFSVSITNELDTIVNSDVDGDILFLVNRKGYATAVICQDCGERALCPHCQLPLVYHTESNDMRCHYCGYSEPTRISCPVCRSPFIRLTGLGIEQMARQIEELIPAKSSWKIMSVDADTEKMKNERGKRILIGTDAALKMIDWEKLRLVVLVDFDRRLAMPELMAQEDLWHLIQEVQFYKPSETNFYIQTRKPDHGLLRALAEPDRWYRLELNHRRALNFPPYSYVVRYLASGKTIAEAESKARHMVAVIEQALTKEPKKIILEGPLQAEPRFLRGGYWNVGIAKISEPSISKTVKWLNQFVPANWKIDPNPRSLLSPH